MWGQRGTMALGAGGLNDRENEELTVLRVS